MIIREITRSDAEEYLNLIKVIDAESEFLLFEEGERSTTLTEQEKRIKELEKIDNRTIFVGEKNNKMIGYLIANGGQTKRNRHSAYIVIGIMKSHTGQGVGTRLFERLEEWAINRNISRLELGLMDRNIPALLLYKKMGFELEGVKKDAFYVNGNYVNEYMMAKILTE